jgi:lysozyme
MMTDADLSPCIKQLVVDEGFVSYCYDDATGKKVIAPVGRLSTGIGLNLQDSPLTYEEAVMVTTMRLRNYERQLSNLFSFFTPLDIVRKSVILNMVYNMGLARFNKFVGLIAALRTNDYQTAHDEILDSDAARKLAARYQRLAVMMATGTFIK